MAASVVAMLLFSAGCGEDDEPAAPAVSDEAKPTGAAEPPDLAAKLVRSRRDEANDRLRIELTNEGTAPVAIDGLRLIAPPFTPEPGEISGGRQLKPGQTTAYRVVHGEPECVGDNPTPGEVTVEVASGDRTITVDPGQSADLIRRLLNIECARARILDVVSIHFDTEWELDSNGSEQVGTLLLERREDGPAVTLTGVRNSINYSLELLEPGSQPTLEPGQRTLAIPVRSRGTRCDGHAMGDNSKPFGFAAFLSLDGGAETLVEFTADEQPENFLRLCSKG